jgi:hypothetical protein
MENLKNDLPRLFEVTAIRVDYANMGVGRLHVVLNHRKGSKF